MSNNKTMMVESNYNWLSTIQKFFIKAMSNILKKILKDHKNKTDSKSDSHLPKFFLLFTSFESPLKMMNNAFYFI